MERLFGCRALTLFYALNRSVGSEVPVSSYAVSSPCQKASVSAYLAVGSMFCSYHDLKKIDTGLRPVHNVELGLLLIFLSS